MANIVPTLLGFMLVLPTIGITISIFRWLRRIGPTTEVIVAISSSQRNQALAGDLYDIQETEARQMHEPGSCAEPLQLRSIRNRRKNRFSSLCPGYKSDTSSISSAFMSFCERLLAMNRIWEQEKQIKLGSDARSVETSRQADSLHAFFNKLLLHNKVWQLERQAGNMELEMAMLKRKLAIMTQVARKMTEELKHERLIQGHVKGMTVEVDPCKLALRMNAHHEREPREFTWEWQQDCWRIGREVVKLNLALQASFVEQDPQNELEDTLYKSLRVARQMVEELEAHLHDFFLDLRIIRLSRSQLNSS